MNGMFSLSLASRAAKSFLGTMANASRLLVERLKTTRSILVPSATGGSRYHAMLLDQNSKTSRHGKTRLPVSHSSPMKRLFLLKSLIMR
jgi:hypothetical protein